MMSMPQRSFAHYKRAFSVTTTRIAAESYSVPITRRAVNHYLKERSAENLHATFCGNRWQVTATDDPVGTL